MTKSRSTRGRWAVWVLAAVFLVVMYVAPVAVLCVVVALVVGLAVITAALV